MKNNNLHDCARNESHTTSVLSVLTIFLLAACGTSQAATMSVSSSAPTSNGADIAAATNIVSTSDYIWFNNPARGQTFTTASNTTGYDLSAFSFYNSTSNNGDLAGITIRIRDSNYSVLREETGYAKRTSNTWVTASLNSIIHLSPNSVYAIEFQSFTTDPGIAGKTWDGFGLGKTTSNYSGGTSYSGGTAANGQTSPSTRTPQSYDYAFHVNMTTAIASIPEPASLGLLSLSLMGLLVRRHRQG